MKCNIPFFHIPEIKGKTTLLQKCHEKLSRIFGKTVCGLVGGSSDWYSRDLSFDSRCAHRLTSGSPWIYTVSEDKCFLSDSLHSITPSLSTVTGCLTAHLNQSLLVLRKQAAVGLYCVMKVKFTTHNSHTSPEK